MLARMSLFPRIIAPAAVIEAARHVLAAGQGPVTVLHDEGLEVAAVAAALPGAAFLDCTAPDAPEPAGGTLVYACAWSSNGLPVLDRLRRRGLRWRAVHDAAPWGAVEHDAEIRAALDEEWLRQGAEGFAKFDFGFGDFANLCQFLLATRALEGCFVEVGCFRGSSGSVALNYMRRRGIMRHAWFLDVFDGFDYAAAKDSPDAFWADTHGTEGEAAVRARLERHAAPEQGLHVHVRRANIITDDLPAEMGPIAVANLDVDLHEAVLAGLHRLHPRMVRGGILVVEDDGHTPLLAGARLAVDEFAASDAAKGLVRLSMESGQTIFVNAR